MMNDNRPRAQFTELVRLHLQGRRLLDRDTERKLLEEGVTRYGLTLDEASGVLRSHAGSDEIALEGEVSRSSSHLLKTMADRRGRVARDDFGKVVAFYRARAGSQLTQPEAERRVKRIMEENDLQPKRSGTLLRTRRWYRAIEI